MTETSCSAIHRSAEYTVEGAAACNKLERPPSSDGSGSNHPPRERIVPPFILAHDLPRGVMYMIQATVAYALMLAAMLVLHHSLTAPVPTSLLDIGPFKSDTSFQLS